MTNYYEVFFSAIKRWIELVRKKIDSKIERSLDNDKVWKKKILISKLGIIFKLNFRMKMLF